MNPSTAMALAAELASAYPARGIGELNLAQYAKALEEVEANLANLAIGDLVRQFPDRPPTLGQIHEALRIRNAYAQPALPVRTAYQSRWLTPAEISHGCFHLRAFFEGDESHRASMRDPLHCECGFVGASG